jgi:coenzyme F420-reducing hydrogenase gamma subunit
MVNMAKKRIGWFTFTCCEDSTILFTELLNTHWEEWKEKLEIVDARVLKTKGEIKNLDISFVEGAISSEEHIRKLKEIRENSKIVIAIGACAVTGMPSGWRNTFDEGTKMEIAFIIDRFKHLPKVEPLKTYITIDAEVPGCPMDERTFLEIINKNLKSTTQ